MEWNWNDISYTEAEILRVHKQFYQPSDSNFFDLIARANPKKQMLKYSFTEEISKACSTFQLFTPKRRKFQVSVPGGIILNHERVLDLMFLNGLPILHVID